MSFAQKGHRGPQCCTHCTKQLKWRRFQQHGRTRESPSFCSKVHIMQQLIASDTSEHNSSPQKRHNWSGSRQLGCTATPQHRDRDNTRELDWHMWQTRSSPAARSTGTTSGGRPANRLLRRRGISPVHDSYCWRNRLKSALESAMGRQRARQRCRALSGYMKNKNKSIDPLRERLAHLGKGRAGNATQLETLSQEAGTRKAHGACHFGELYRGSEPADGCAERAVHAIGEQVCVLRRGLEHHLGLQFSGKHSVMVCLWNTGADVLLKYQVGK